jgi:hypothetical protein
MPEIIRIDKFNISAWLFRFQPAGELARSKIVEIFLKHSSKISKKFQPKTNSDRANLFTLPDHEKISRLPFGVQWLFEAGPAVADGSD